MKTLLYMAMSVNGMINRPDGNEDFLSEDNWSMLKKLARQHGNLIIGRKTAEIIESWGPKYSLDDLLDVHKVVLSHQSELLSKKGWFIATSPAAALSFISSQGKTTALVSGGSSTNAAFAAAGLIDDIVLNLESIIVPTGVPMISNNSPDLKLQLRKQEPFGSHGITLHYSVIK